MFKFYSLLILFCMVMSEGHAEVKCAPKPEGMIDVSWSSKAIQYDFRKTQSQMNNMQNDTINPYGDHVETHVGGLMNGGIGIKSQVQVSTLNYPRARKICQWVANMDVRITIDPKILIARQHKKGSCRHNAILEHEMKHVFVDREVVKKYQQIIKNELQKAVREIGIVGPKDERDRSLYQDKITKHMEAALKKVNDRMYDERRKKQQAVDSKAEYERVARLCR